MTQEIRQKKLDPPTDLVSLVPVILFATLREFSIVEAPKVLGTKFIKQIRMSSRMIIDP